MKKRYYQTIQIDKEVVRKREIICDVCGKTICEYSNLKKLRTKVYYKVQTGVKDSPRFPNHVEHICSVECLKARMDDYIKLQINEKYNNTYFKVRKTTN